jgi:L-iditol 2-dehydrogenase
VEFFPNPKEALFAGYRPCKRCRPLEPAGSPPRWLREVLSSVEGDPGRRWTDGDLRELGLEPDRVRRWFKDAHAVLNWPTVSPGDVAVIAGPGAIGLLTLQVVKASGATVIMLGTDSDAGRMELAQQLGTDYTLNVQQDDPLALIKAITDEGLGADVVYECSGAGPAAAQILELVRRRGRYVQIGLFGKPVAWDLDQLCYKELVATGSNASVPSAWFKALRLLETGVVKTAPLITHRYDITEWEAAFATFEDKSGVKTILRPVG